MDIAVAIMGVLAYFAVGVFVAYWIPSFLDKPRWWHFPLVTLFWPLIPLLLFFAMIAWMSGGSH